MFFKFVFLFVLSLSGAVEGSAKGDGGRTKSFYCAENANPCLNSGICEDAKTYPSLGISYQCRCVGGCSGWHCETCPTSDNPCIPNPCRGDCSCVESCKHALGYYCRSATGYLGKNCTTPPPTLNCYSDRITVTVAESFVREYDNGLQNSYLVVQPGLSTASSAACQLRSASNGFYQVTIPLPFNNCGTQSRQLAGGNMVFENQIWFNRDLKNARFDMPIPAVAFECIYAREYDVVTSLVPTISEPLEIQETKFISPTISLCKSNACPADCPESLRVNRGGIYTVGENVYVKMTLDTGNHVTTVRKMALSCSAVPGDASNSVAIIEGGCGTVSGLPCDVTHNGASHTVCVNFQMPRGLQCNEIYIHATLSSCFASSITDCAGGSHFGNKCSGDRRRRSIDSEAVVGPFFVIMGSRGEPSMRMFPDDELTISSVLPSKSDDEIDITKNDFDMLDLPTDGEPNTNMVYLLPLVVLSILTICLLIMFLFFMFRSKNVDPQNVMLFKK